MEQAEDETSLDRIYATVNQPQNISIKQILNAINRSSGSNHPFKTESGKDIIIFQGLSGTGKSSTALTFSGEPMVGYLHQRDKIPILMSKNMAGKQGVRIEQQYIAGTIDPAIIELSKQFDKSNSIVMWDMPGSGDNRGINQKIINSYFYTRVFEVQRYIKLALLISHNDLESSEKAAKIQQKLADFVRMFGNVQNFSQSMIIIITKCPSLHYQKEDAIQSFKEMSKMPFLQKDLNIRTLVKFVAQKKIDIIIMKRPLLTEGALVTKKNAIDVTKQYKQVIEQFSIAVKKLKGSQKIKLQSPLQQKDILGSSELVSSTNFSKNLKRAKDSIKAYLKSFQTNFENNFQDTEQIKKICDDFLIMKNFTIKIKPLINKEHAFKNADEVDSFLNNLYELFKEQPFEKKVSENDQICPILIDLKNSMIIISFLNALDYNKYYKLEFQIEKDDIIEETQLNTIAAANVIIENLKRLKIQMIWKATSESIEQKLQESITNFFQSHLNQWQNYKIYQTWKKNFKYFPALCLSVSRDMEIKRLQPNFTIEYFCQIEKKEENVSIKSADLKAINDILKYYKDVLRIQLNGTLIDYVIAPMLERKYKDLIDIVTNLQKMEKDQVKSAILEYIHQQNIEKSQPRILTEENNKLRNQLQTYKNQSEINKKYQKLQQDYRKKQQQYINLQNKSTKDIQKAQKIEQQCRQEYNQIFMEKQVLQSQILGLKQSISSQNQEHIKLLGEKQYQIRKTFCNYCCFSQSCCIRFSHCFF